MPAVSVTASLITRDEQHNITRCLESLVRRVDEIVVADTGSTDGTVDLARRAGARIVNFPWTGDFAAARNFCRDACRTDWVLYIDADEQLAGPGGPPLGACLEPRWLAADVLFRPKANYTRYRLTRLFRNDRRLRFEGAIHESILPAIATAAAEDGCVAPIGLTALAVDHHGYDGEMSAKHARNLPLLETCAARYPARVFYRMHLVETFLGLGRLQEAVTAAHDGIRAARETANPKNLADAAIMCQMLAASLLARGTDAMTIIAQGLQFHPDNHALRLTQARRELVFGDPAAGLAIARELQTVDGAALVPGLVAYDLDIFGRSAAEIEIACFAKLGRLAEAARTTVEKRHLLARSPGMAARRADQR
jgi:hypothetical protein